MSTIPLHTYEFCVIYVDYVEEENKSSIYYTYDKIHTLEEAKVEVVQLTWWDKHIRKRKLLDKTVDKVEEIEEKLLKAHNALKESGCILE